MSLLYFLDFTHYRETGRSVTGLDYYAWDHGPVPREFFEELSNPSPDLNRAVKQTTEKFGEIEAIKYEALVDFRPEVFSKREFRLMEKID